MKKRIRSIILILCLFMFLSTAVHSIPSVLAAEKSVEITLNGQQVHNITIKQSDKETLLAAVNGIENPSFQWQILNDPQNSVWVNIYDRTETSCEISYALVKNMLDDANSTYIRCMAKSGDETVYSDMVCVTVSIEQEPDPQVTSFAQTRYVENSDTSDAPAMFAMARNTTTDYVTITIKYLDAASLGGTEEAAIYSPYTATILQGTDFKQSVVSPTFLGFAPYLDSNDNQKLDDNDESAATLNLDYDSVTENKEIKVYYKPIEVNFAVKYFFQNINDDLYTENASRYHTDKAETGTIVTNEYLESNAGETTGFTKMYHIPESVAADGSTVFECYYDRNYYLIQFDLNGGYGVDPIYARYETPFVVNDPIRHGYKFAGWKLICVDTNANGEWDDPLPDGVSSGLVSTIPAYNYYYQAQWETVETIYTVVYWLKKEDGSYSYVGSRIASAESGTEVSGEDDLGSANISGINTKYYVYETADQNVLVDGDGSTVVNVYYKPKKYTLRFYYAATTGTGTGTDDDGAADTYDTVRIIGGSTYYFGNSYGVNTSDDAVLLNRIYNMNNMAGEVTKLPQLNEEGKSRNYTPGSITSGNNTYHYIEFTAEYGQDISDLWPCAVFDSATRTDISNNSNGWTGDQAFVSAWNGEHHVWYSQNNGNETIKGNYEKLDSQLLFDPKYDDETTVSYLCFWENGAGGIHWNVPKLFVYNIWVPVLAGDVENDSATTTVDGLPIQTKEGVTYKLIDSYDTCDDSNIGGQTQPSLEGYKALSKSGTQITLSEEQKKIYKEGYNVDFYYARETNTFAMKNYGEYLVNIETDNTGTGGVPFGTKISSLRELDVLQENFTPSYPSTLEENAYYFEGWYTTEQCIPGTKVDLSTETMPASGLILYANWVPQTHTVRFFTAYDDLTSFESDLSGTVYFSSDVRHGETVGTVETPVRSGDGTLELTFAGWFYMENGQKKAFSPLNMPINRDMNIFAEWSSHSPQPYRISYVLQSDQDVHVADDTVGYAYGGSTRTFNAKAGDPYNQLYNEYNNGYFPTVSSHSITIQAEADKENLQHNIFTFYYVKAENITYTVRYVNKETNVVMDSIECTTTSAVVTERFKAYPDMVPDAFYKRLVLEVVWDEEQGKYVGTENNVITFYYTPNDTSAYYAVHFMLEKLEATDEEKENYDINGNGGYEETGTHIEGVGKINSTVYISPQIISGFELIDNDKVPIILSDGNQSAATYSSGNSGYGITITQSGTELYLFYERQEYPYTVHYYKYNTTDSLKDSKHSKAYYGADVTESAEKIDGHTCVSDQTQTITIREDDGSEELNIIIFYYAPIQYVAEYVAVPDDGGWLSNTIEVISGTEALTGSVPTANQYYEFAGWYLDEACTQTVSEYGKVDEQTNCFTPDKTKLSETQRNIFYAKFVKKVGDFTIDRNDARDTDQVFVYEIKNNDTAEIIYVTVTGNGSTTICDLPFGEYTVIQQNDWSWRYNDESSSVSHQNTEGTTVVFSKAEQTDQWLNGNSGLVKNKRG